MLKPLPLLVLVLALVLATPTAAVAGGDEGQAPPSAGAPGPWNEREVGEGEDLPYKPTDATSCRLGETRAAGAGTVLGVWVVGTRCGTGKRLVRRYQRCLKSESGRNRRCYSRIEKRCVRRVFLGRCWLRERLLRRQVRGYGCTERRLYEVKTSSSKVPTPRSPSSRASAGCATSTPAITNTGTCCGSSATSCARPEGAPRA